MQDLPLKGIRVIDFGQMWAGPHLAQWLAVMGAEVIKVETILRLDFMRMVGIPPGIERGNVNAGTAFLSLNFGKKSITLNMNQPRARELARDLIAKSDVVTENFGGPILERWGLSYDEVKEIKPDIIMYAGSGYGRSGPHRARPAYAEIVEAFDGSTYLNGYPGSNPYTVGVSPWTDATQAMHGAFAIMTALYHRNNTGEGQYIDAAMIEGSTNFLGEMIMGYTINGEVGERVGNRDKVMAPHNCYRCRGEDEWVAIAVSSEDEWKAFCDVIGCPEWTKEVKFSTEALRHENHDELDDHINRWTGQRSQYEVSDSLQQAGVPAGPSLNTNDLVDDPQLKHRKFFVDMEHPVVGHLTLAGLPWKPEGDGEGNYSPAPTLGQHNHEVFGGILRLSEDEISRLIEEEVIH
ncbi:MAG: CoA transferase [Dehalococcoidales bacterium]|nr:CoA transferase [Dehalococcoidales bacterium]